MAGSELVGAKRDLSESGWEYADMDEMMIVIVRSSEAVLPVDLSGWTSVHYRR